MGLNGEKMLQSLKHLSQVDKMKQVGRLFQVVPRHFVQQRAFHMHHFIVGEGQHKIF